jgi:hypothetical protein
MRADQSKLLKGVGAYVLALAWLAGNAASAGGLAIKKPVDCAHSPILVGKCFTVHGRLMIYQGFWNYRLWPVGTHRLLAAVSSTGACCDNVPIVPLRIDRALSKDPDGVEIFANWQVCPITPQKSGVMQQVCIESAHHVVIRDTLIKPNPATDR